MMGINLLWVDWALPVGLLVQERFGLNDGCLPVVLFTVFLIPLLCILFLLLGILK